MAKLSVKQIQQLALSIVAGHPGGIRYSALVAEILGRHPETPKNTVNGSVWNLDQNNPTLVSKPTRGIFAPVNTTDSGITETETIIDVAHEKKLIEADFYEPFAEWLKNDLDEVVEVAPLGGAGLKGKWGTPDVIGVYKPLASQLIKFPVEIVSVEIKIDPSAPTVAFGQAIAYRLFSTKVYIAMPTTISEEDESRLSALCILFGVGFATFELNKEAPEFDIRVNAQRNSPDMFYVNEFADRLRQHNHAVFQKLFG